MFIINILYPYLRFHVRISLIHIAGEVMIMNNKKLITATELEIMNLLWNTGSPMTASEIVENSKDKPWKPSYVHLAINSLLKKGFIDITGFKQTTKNYARTFKPSLSKSELIVKSIFNEYNTDDIDTFDLISEVIQRENDSDTLKRIIDLCREKISMRE